MQILVVSVIYVLTWWKHFISQTAESINNLKESLAGENKDYQEDGVKDLMRTRETIIVLQN